MAETTQPCTHCGAVMPLSQLLEVDEEGRQVLVCPDCAFAVPTGVGGSGRKGTRGRK